MKTLTLVDGSGYIFRAYHALPPLTNPQGVPIGAVVGFVNMLIKLINDSTSDAIAVVFDHGRINFRHQMYDQYKANRPPAPEDLVPQFPLTRDAARALNLAVIDVPDVEADDVIASYAKHAAGQGYQVTIISSDKDLMQLIGPQIRMFDAMKQKVIAEPEVMEKFGVAPDRVLDVLSLIGDSSDNVPGVPGIGPKTAAELINTYGDLDSLLARASEIKQDKRRATIMENADKARLSRDLIRLKEDVALPYALEELATKPIDSATLVPFLTMHGFKSALSRIGAKDSLPHRGRVGEGASTDESNDRGKNAPLLTSPLLPPLTSPPLAGGMKGGRGEGYRLIQTEAALLAVIKQAQEAGFVVIDTETTGLNTMSCGLVGLSFATKEGEAFYLPLKHVTGSGDGDLFSSGLKPAPGQLNDKLVLSLIKPLLEDETILKIGHNIKFDMEVLACLGIRIAPIEDTMVMSYVLHAGEHGQGMDELAERYLGYKTITYDEVTGTGRTRKTFAEVDLQAACNYAAEDADVTLKLWELFKREVAEQKLQTLYQTIERPCITVIADMEMAGVLVDAQMLLLLSNQFAIDMARLEKEITEIAGVEFNVGSPKQLGDVLFEHLKLPGGKKSKIGAYGTDAGVLEELAEEGHAIAAKVLEWRQMQKLKSTYTDALPKQINARTGRVHTNFGLTIASTGRLSSSDPNLQNIPIRSEMGKKIRSAFIAPEGKSLIGADYSQIELRLLAHVADIAPLKAAFKEGRDIHAITASEMFGVPVAEVSSDLRRRAKTINFGIIYGISAHGLSVSLGISRGEAAEYIDCYFKQYPGIRDYMEVTKEVAREKGYVETLFGRRCHVPGINDKNGARRQFFERAAINAPLQGSAADIIKRAMVAIARAMADDRGQMLDVRKEGSLTSNIQHLSSVTMLLQVHDELVFECPTSEVDAAAARIRPLMENAASLSVPLVVDIKSGKHWGEVH